MRNNRSSIMGGMTGGIVLIGLALAFLVGGGFNLPIFFIALAFASLFGSMSSGSPRGIYGGIQGAFWMLTLAVFFITGSWVVFLIAAGISAILGTLVRPIMAGLGSMAFFGMKQPQQPQYYQPPQQPQQYYQPPQQPYQPYQEGYQPPAPQPETYQEGGQQHPYPSQPAQQYEQPQAEYPQQMPPQQ
ncbi:MAG: hypothetical protein H0V70_18690 [Ktedonobacteraceae bacterium]|nr:hypothetical protein [Ktedonobacteraceae bacterium]